MLTQLNFPSKYCNQSSTKTLSRRNALLLLQRILDNIFFKGKKKLAPEQVPGLNLKTALWKVAVKNLRVLNISSNTYKSYTYLFKST